MAPLDSSMINKTLYNETCFIYEGMDSYALATHRNFFIVNLVIKLVTSGISLILNGLIVFSTCRAQGDISVTEKIDFSLALPDLLSCTLCVTISAVHDVFLIIGVKNCKLAQAEAFFLHWLGGWSVFSIWTAVADRFLSIFYPYVYEDLTIVKRVWPDVAIALCTLTPLCLSCLAFVPSAALTLDIIVAVLLFLHVFFGFYTYGRILLLSRSMRRKVGTSIPKIVNEQRLTPLATKKSPTRNIASTSTHQHFERSSAADDHVQGDSQTQGDRLDVRDEIAVVVPSLRQSPISSERRQGKADMGMSKGSKRTAVLFFSELVLHLPIALTFAISEQLHTDIGFVVLTGLSTWVYSISIVTPIIYFWSMSVKREIFVRRMRLFLSMNR